MTQSYAGDPKSGLLNQSSLILGPYDQEFANRQQQYDPETWMTQGDDPINMYIMRILGQTPRERFYNPTPNREMHSPQGLIPHERGPYEGFDPEFIMRYLNGR